MEQNNLENNVEPQVPTETNISPKNKQKSNKKKILLLILLVVAIVVCCGVAFAIVNKDTTKNSNGSAQNNKTTEGDAFAEQYLNGCKEREVTFSQAPLAIKDLKFMEPLGKVNDGHVTPTDHVYITPKLQTSKDNTTPVIMPADGTVSLVAAMPSQYIGDRNQQTAAEDHRIAVMHNCRFVSIFIHVHRLSDKLKKEVGSLQPNQSKNISLELKAGETIGYIGANPVDWTLADAKTTLPGFITPSLYEGEPWKVHTIDPISVYSGEAKNQLIAASLRTSEPYGGKIDYDKKGTLQGNWFKEGTNGYSGKDMARYWDGHLSITPDYLDPSATSVSIGNWQGKANQFIAVAAMPKPDVVTEKNGAVKLEIVRLNYTTASGAPFTGQPEKNMKALQSGKIEGVLLVQVLPGEKLKVETFPGKTAAQVTGFTESAAIYMR